MRAQAQPRRRRKGLVPSFRRHTDVRKATGRAIEGDGGRLGEEERDHGADERRADGGESDLSGDEGDGAGDHCDDDRADHARPAVVGGEAQP